MTIETELVTTLRLDIGTRIDVGVNQHGLHRRIAPIEGGEFDGPKLSGTVVPGGADWSVQRADRVSEHSASYVLRTHDGAFITIHNSGYLRLRYEQSHLDIRGDADKISSWYFRLTPRFEVADPRYRWLTSSIFVADARNTGSIDRSEITIFQVL